MNSFIKQEIIKYKSENPKARMEEICGKFDISIRTLNRYLAEIKKQKKEEELIPESVQTLKEIFESFVLPKATNEEETPEHKLTEFYEYIVDESFPSPTEQEEQNSKTEDRYFLVSVIVNNQYYTETTISGNFPNRKKIFNLFQKVDEQVEYIAVQNIYEFKNKDDHDAYLSE